MGVSKCKTGRIIIPSNCFPGDHEIMTARVFADLGFDVEFLPTSTREKEKSPDVKICGIKWEMKAPKSDKLSAVERNLKKATKQSENVIFDSRRMKSVPDYAIERELKKQKRVSKRISRLIMVNKKQEAIEIS